MGAMEKYLVLGASGVVGRNLMARLGDKVALATYHSRPVPGAVRFDLGKDSLDTVLSAAQGATGAFLLLGMTNIDACHTRQAEARKINVDAILDLAKALADMGVKPVFTSTDYVFGGNRGGYREEDQPDPITAYGAFKAEVEKDLMETVGNYAVARLSRVIGAQRGDGSLFDGWMDAIENNEPIHSADDQIFSPIFATDAVEALVWLADSGANGLYNVCGPEAWSRYGLCAKFCDKVSALGKPVPQILRCKINGMGLKAIRPLDTSMSSSKLSRASGIKLMGADEMMERFLRSCGHGAPLAV